MVTVSVLEYQQDGIYTPSLSVYESGLNRMKTVGLLKNVLKGEEFYTAARKYLNNITDERFYSLTKLIDSHNTYKNKEELIKSDKLITFFVKNLLNNAFDLTIENSRKNSETNIKKEISSPHEEFWNLYKPVTMNMDINNYIIDDTIEDPYD